jgi:hypothetical protein
VRPDDARVAARGSALMLDDFVRAAALVIACAVVGALAVVGGLAVVGAWLERRKDTS